MFKYSVFSDYSLINFCNDQLYMNHYESFNDPFECMCEISTGFPSKDSDSPRVKEIIRAWGFEDSNALENYNDYVSSLADTEMDITAMIDSVRISCFSKRQNNLLMWAHYANGLRGFCLEFDPQLVLASNIGSAEIFEVIYNSKPANIDTAVIAVLNDQIEFHEDAIYDIQKRINYIDETQKESKQDEMHMYREYLDMVYIKNRDIYQKMLANKSVEWSYEEEMRIILQTNKYDKIGLFMKYPAEAVKSIIIGEKMPERQRDALRKVVEGKTNPINLKIASRINGQFEIEINDLV